MNEIKSLADQLREQLRTGETQTKNSERVDPPLKAVTGKQKKGNTVPASSKKIDDFFAALESFKPELTEKSMIRVDPRTLNLLKRLKLAKGIDMNRFIVYALHQYLAQHPWLPQHIRETLKNSEL